MLSSRLEKIRINVFNSRKFLFLLWLTLLVFPKGGIKIEGVPLTWGYLFLGILSIASLLTVPIRINRDRLISFICLVPFQIFCAFVMLVNGISGIGITISFWVNFLFLPCAFYLFFSKHIDSLDIKFFFNIFKNGVFFIAIYGVFLFVFKQTTGSFIEIPLLTTNFGDLGELEHKHINRGVVFKLISTYNNGNIYGICLLILLPLYCFLERSFWRNALVKFSLILTFSRTVWIGLIFHELCYQFIMSKNIIKSFFNLLAKLIAIAACLLGVLAYYGFRFGFLVDQDLGGRKAYLDVLNTIGLFAVDPFCGILEIIYAGIVVSFGWLSLPLFIFGLCGPLFYQILVKRLSYPHKCIALGLCNYLLVSCSDGAILLIPTMAFYWFFLSLLHRKSLVYIEGVK